MKSSSEVSTKDINNDDSNNNEVTSSPLHKMAESWAAAELLRLRQALHGTPSALKHLGEAQGSGSNSTDTTKLWNEKEHTNRAASSSLYYNFASENNLR